jgi:hypothetical protein
VIGEYLLGVRERNIRVIYYRPYPHVIQVESGGSTITESAEQTNLDLLSRLTAALKANGFAIGRASGFVDFKGAKLDALYVLAGLGVAAALLLLFELQGWSRPWTPWALFGITVAAFAAGMATSHADAVRKLWAFGGAVTLAVLASTTLAAAFHTAPSGNGLHDAARGTRLLLVSAGIALLGGLYVTGLLSQAAFMIEVDQFFGVKALLVAPPAIVALLYAFTPMFGSPRSAADVAGAPVRAWMLAALLALGTAIVLLIIRSGNQPDIGVSNFELNLRGALTAIMGARPRFKEFLIGYPPIFLLAALTPEHRRAAGWALVLCAAVGLADILDTFSHIHTALSVGLLRTLNGAVLGAAIGILAQWLYRRMFVRGKSRGPA